jgi:ABC-type lipoprotein export system ATPase subunit
MSEDFPIIKVVDLHKSYKLERNKIDVLTGINLTINKGEWIALLGASGSGKTTLLNQLGNLEKPDTGDIYFYDEAYSKFSGKQAAQFRANKLGFVFQAYHLLPELNVLENVMLPGMILKKNSSELKKLALSYIERMGLSHRLKHKSNELSGGEQQRVALARALINNPELLLADEPTGNLDSATGKEILDIFQELHDSAAHTIVMVTHDQNIAKLADRIVHLVDGKIVD